MATIVKESPESAVFKKYGLEPSPDSVTQLTRLVANQDTSSEQIANVVNKDKALTKQLLQFANPRAESEGEYSITTVEAALMRTGMSPIVLLTMLNPLTRAVSKTFEMFGKPVAPMAPEKLPPLTGEHVMGTVEIHGKAAGMVSVRMEAPVARLVAAAILRVPIEELNVSSEIDDVIGEMVNMCAGNLKSNLCDSGIHCKLSVPSVNRTMDDKLIIRPNCASKRLGFSSTELHAFVDVSINPWAQAS